MRKTIKRAVAYAVDLMVLVLLASLITNTPAINRQLNNYNKYYEELVEKSEEYNDFLKDLDDYYENEELTKENYQSLITEYEGYKEDLDKYYEDEVLEPEEYDKLKDDLKTSYEKEYKELYYKIEKNSTISYIAYLIITVLYFGVFNVITNGQTLGKKIFRLKIVKKNGQKAGFFNYILRSILLYNSIYYLVVLIGVYTINPNSFYTLSSVTYEIQYYLQWIIIIMMMLRADGRGLHDFIGGTKVIELDREGNEIKEESLWNLKPEENKEEKESQEIIGKKEKTTNKKKSKVIDATVEEKEE